MLTWLWFMLFWFILFWTLRNHLYNVMIGWSHDHNLLKIARVLRWSDTMYLHEGQLFWNQIFSCSTAFDCWDILDAEKGMLEVYQKRVFIEIDTNIRKFSAIFLNVVFKENAYYRENEKTFFLHITLNRCWNLKDFRDQVSDKSAPHNLYNKRWLK